jgi:hypothetical protein
MFGTSGNNIKVFYWMGVMIQLKIIFFEVFGIPRMWQLLSFVVLKVVCSDSVCANDSVWSFPCWG